MKASPVFPEDLSLSRIEPSRFTQLLQKHPHLVGVVVGLLLIIIIINY